MADQNELQDSIRILEEGKESFESQSIHDEQYYQCITLLGKQYLKYYLENQGNQIGYLRRARSISRQLQNSYYELGSAHKYANTLKNDLRKYGPY